MVSVAALALAGCGADDDREPAATVTDEETLAAIAGGHVRAHERDADHTTTDVEVDGDRATVTITFEGMHDDSVSAERRVVTFARRGEDWSLVSDEATYRCHRGRGQQEFGRELCS